MNGVGIDPSLTGTAIAAVDGTVTLVKTRGLVGPRRLVHIRQHVTDAALIGVDLVAIEGYAYGTSHSAHVMGELGGVIRVALHEIGVAYVDIPPGVLKKYATGSGSADKTAVVVSARDRLGYDGTNDNCADALWLRAIAYDILGVPVVELPKVHAAALNTYRPSVIDVEGVL